ncbi:hypothetical protein [Jiella pacifica]|uniref:Uncharacterized protein n=1 Tax=Jiella pacifica TaxID=2696469 RepID=A0A6N9SXY5_9HYPH|nr:hypothetical protein [Jiella pacifica]NDW03947.1 hypothetical protein [Jiella pacifica]
MNDAVFLACAPQHRIQDTLRVGSLDSKTGFGESIVKLIPGHGAPFIFDDGTRHFGDVLL